MVNGGSVRNRKLAMILFNIIRDYYISDYSVIPDMINYLCFHMFTSYCLNDTSTMWLVTKKRIDE